jgi:hypothetical protein
MIPSFKFLHVFGRTSVNIITCGGASVSLGLYSLYIIRAFIQYCYHYCYYYYYYYYIELYFVSFILYIWVMFCLFLNVTSSFVRYL